MGDVHNLLEARGKQQALALAEGRRGPRIIEAAAAWSADEDIGTGYMYLRLVPDCPAASPTRR